jgi:outer membrane lipoprotein-sorting protein
MSFLRTISTRRLLALVAAIVLVGVGGTAIALAATGGGPLPPPKRLAVAVYDALRAPDAQGVSGRVKFTNHLIDSADLEGVSPLLKGASGRFWFADGRLRLELQSDQGDSQLVVDGKRFWAYDAISNTVYRGSLPRRTVARPAERETHRPPSFTEIEKAVQRVARQADLSGAVPTDEAGRPAYSVRISPKRKGGLLGAAEVAWDVARGVPLRVAVYSRGNDSPVLELKVTDISYGHLAASDFAVSPPRNAKVVDLSLAPRRESHAKKKLPFRVSAPSTLAGLKRHEVRTIEWKGQPAALVTYGRDLGGIAVVERTAEAQSYGRMRLPSVSINGESGEELATPLGTMVHFQHAGVDYTVIGSVSAASAEAAARALTR